MILQMPVWIRLSVPLAFLLLAGCKDDVKPQTSVAPPVTEESVSLDLQTYSYDPTPTKQSAPEVVEVRIRTTPKAVTVYDQNAKLLGSSQESGTFTTHVVAGKKIHLHFQKDGYQSSVLELVPGGLIEIHYISLEKK